MAGTDQLLRWQLLVLTFIALACGDEKLGPPISTEEFIKALADPSLMAPPPNGANALVNSGEFQGDIMLTPDQEAQMGKGRSATKGSLWANGIMPYTISYVFTASERQVIARAIAEFEAKTCLRIVPRTTETDYVEIVSSTGCWSQVGRVGGLQQLSLRQPDCLYFGVVLHEFMHAAGFWHEQSRYDRDSYVIINWQNIIPAFKYAFDIQGQDVTTDLGLQYDYSSVMHYPAYAFTANQQPTITPRKAGVTLGQMDGFSQLDVIGLNLLYKCEGTACTDQHESCKDWADSGECKKNPDYMLTSCAKACNQCGSECTDKDQSCQDWADSGECEKNPDYMLTSCPKACNQCGSECTDENENCQDWADSGECEKNPDYMLTSCAKACNQCDGGDKKTTEGPTEPPVKCETKKPCKKKGGECQPKSSACKGKIINKGCDKKAGCVCCIPGTCTDKNKNCNKWKNKGFCKSKKKMMEKKCPKICKMC